MASLRIHIHQMGFWLSLSVALPLSAQQTTWSVGTSLGYALPHRNEMLALVTGHSREMTCRIGNWNTTGWRQNWQQHGPVWQGVQVGWLNGGSEELGDMASAMWLVELPVRRRWHIELGSGVGWSTSPYDPIERPLSIAIGSRLNAAIHLGTTVQVVQREQSWVAVGAGFTHFSNGALALPNLGINNVHLRVRAGWKTSHRFPERTPAAWMDTTEGWHWACAGRIGARDINLPGGVLHPTVSVGAYAERKATATHSWVLAVDLAHNQSLRQFSETPLSMPQKLQLSSLAGVNLHFGHAQLMLLQGWLWTRPDEALGRVPFQAILAYAVRPSWAIEMGLRSFRIRADYPFIGIRYSPRATR